MGQKGILAGSGKQLQLNKVFIHVFVISVSNLDEVVLFICVTT